MADGSITFSTALDNKELEKQLSSLTKKVNNLESKISQKQTARAPMVEQAQEYGAALDEAKVKLETLKAQQAENKAALAIGTTANPEAFATAYTQREGIAADVAAQQAEVDKLQKTWDTTESKVEKYDAAIKSATTELESSKEKAGAIAQKLARMPANQEKMSKATDRANSSLDTFKKRVASVVRSALVFTVITQALAKLRDWIADVIQVSPEAKAAVAQLKGALLTLAQPLVNVVIPAFTALVNVITQVILAIARLVSMIAGTTIAASAKSAKALNNQTSALEATGSAAKKAGKSLAAFDEINQLSGDSDSGGGAAGTTISPDFSNLSGLETQEYKNKIDELTAYISGALLALGVILAFSGANIPLGIGLMALGAVGLAAVAKENWGVTTSKVKTVINNTLLLLADAGLAIGAILAFSGVNVPLGIGLMALGATALGTAVALNWNTIKAALTSPVGAVAGIFGGITLLALGAVLAFTGVSLPLGITLLALGAVSLATATALNWGTIKNKLAGPVGSTAAIFTGLALLALGAVLSFTGVALPLGIALMALGAAGLATAAVLNWGKISSLVKTAVADITAILSGALIVLGVLLCLSGAGIGLGLAVLAAGLAGSYAAWKIDDNPITNFVKKMANSIIAIINTVINAINEMFHISFGGLQLLGKTIITAFDTRLVNIPNIPALANGAVIPPNQEFLAMLGDQKSGTNIEAPESLLRKIMREENGAGVINITVELDGEVVYRNQKKVSRRHGTSLAPA